MEKKNVILSILCVIVALCTVAVFIINVFDIKLNPIKHHSFKQDGYTLTFKGSFGEVRKLLVKKDSKKLCSLPFESDTDVFDGDSEYTADFIDVNADGVSDLVLTRDIDSDNDTIRAVYLADKNGGFIYTEGLYSLSNPEFNSELTLVFTKETTKEILVEASKNNPEYYILTHTITKIGFDANGAPLPLAQRAITYYSENDLYCYSVYEHDEAFGCLKYVDEQWFEPSELDKYPLNWD